MKTKSILFSAGIVLATTVGIISNVRADEEGGGAKTYDTETCKLTVDHSGNQRTGSWCNPVAINGPCREQSSCH